MKIEQPRLFVAVPIDPSLRVIIAIQCKELQQKYPFQKWTDPEDYHITLKFLGETPSEKVEAIQEVLLAVSQTTVPFLLNVKGWGTFGRTAAPSILWAGIGGEVELLTRLQRQVEEALVPLGYIKEDRPFHPHLTLARKYLGKSSLEAAGLQQQLAQLEGSLIQWSVNHMVLYQSHLKRKPMYEPLSTFQFLNEPDS
ncbi:MAG: 2-5 ligase [Bacilli bacterium]|nr:2-5 ligase [Bacilli bacterium]